MIRVSIRLESLVDVTCTRFHLAPFECAVIDGFKYAKSHEYVNMDGDVATIGISDFAQVRHYFLTARL